MSQISQYITIDSLLASFGDQLYKLVNVDDGTELRENKAVANVIEAANAQVDAALRQRYELPLTRPTAEARATLRDIAECLFKYKLITKLRPEILSEADDIDHRECLKRLKAIADGDVLLEAVDQNTAESIASPVKADLRSGISNDPVERAAKAF